MSRKKTLLNRVGAIVGCAGLIVCGLLSGCAADPDSRPDSMVAVLANPSAYEGKLISIRGFVNLEKDGDAIYLAADDYRWSITANAIWLHMPHCANRAGGAVTQGYMTVVGNFTSKLHGQANAWVGEIDNIRVCRLIEGVGDEPRPRPIQP